MVLSALLALTACGGGGSSDVSERLTLTNSPTPQEPTAPPPPPPDPGPQPGDDFRVFRLGASAVQMLPLANRPLRNGHAGFPIASLRNDLDVFKLVADYIGIPYDLFAENSEPPEDHPWTIAARQLIADALEIELPLILQLGLARRSMVGSAILDEDGELVVDLTWAPPCFDFSAAEAAPVGDAYVNYAAWLARELQPAYVVSFSEANLYYRECGGATAAWDELVEIQRRAYEAIKRAVPGASVFASFNLEALYGDTLDGWDEDQYQALSKMSYDTFSMASYPFGITREGGVFVTPYDLPPDYLSRVLTHHPEEKRLSIAETGWNNVSIAVGDTDSCFENFPYSEPRFAADYFEFVVNTAHRQEFDFLSWFSFRDALPANVLGTCYVRTDSTDPDNDACLQEFWCQAINQAKNTVLIPGATALFSEVVQKAFGAMGLQEYDGTSRGLLLDRWREVLALPLQHELAPAPDADGQEES
ncbi:MAG: hypothetical protein R3E54_02320 [Halioglobus sp.]